ncbi:hypothetical protein SAMN05421538_107162 [Paracoccus isoporae]|uniref:Uncharacterized protein n=1 Tax=Paracoccus isoporae TaxID=591205 RepID=A0A1G7DPK0_9RHOB|nr:hypothetical protein [Paracoccus isoporae]SDE53076.1 hypothetical protein SAMN05421538_107162 [Paracoccus isoporae]
MEVFDFAVSDFADEAEQAPERRKRKQDWSDIDESGDADPAMPEGYQITSVRRLTKKEAEAEGHGWPAIKAVVMRGR